MSKFEHISTLRSIYTARGLIFTEIRQCIVSLHDSTLICIDRLLGITPDHQGNMIRNEPVICQTCHKSNNFDLNLFTHTGSILVTVISKCYSGIRRKSINFPQFDTAENSPEIMPLAQFIRIKW